MKLINEIIEKPESRREWLIERFSKACEHLKRGQKYKVWQNGCHAKELFGNAFIYQKLEYVHRNPVEDEIVEFAEDYLYCSAPVYAGRDGLLECVCLPQRLRTV